MKEWHCRCCGEVHGELPMHYGAAAPAVWFTIPETEREERAILSSDMCLIDEQHGFIVGNVEIPVVGSDELFSWDVWVSLSLFNFKRAVQIWEQPSRESEPPYFGWVSTSLAGYLCET